jgi:hypothetical protein
MAKGKSGTVKSQGVRGLYFPYANIDSVRTLKTALLYFDRISVIRPQAAFCHESRPNHPFEPDRDAYISQLDVLAHEGAVDLVDPASVIEQFGNEIMTGVIQDIHDHDFMGVCEPLANSSWTLSSAKLPTVADKWLRNMLVNVPTLIAGGAVTHQFEEHRYGFTERGPYPRHGAMRHREGVFEFREGRRGRYQGEDEAQRVRDIMFDEYRLVELPFCVGESIMIEHAIAICATEGLTPFSDEGIHFNALKSRLRRSTGTRALKSLLYEYGYLRDVKADLLALDVISDTVPNLELVPIDSILEFRKRRASELQDFQQAMRELQTEIESTPWDEQYQKQVLDVIDSSIKPAMRKLENEIRGCRDAFWADAVKAVAQVSPLPIVGSLFAGVPAHVAVGLGAAFAGLSLVLEKWAKMKTIKRNGWALLFDAGQLGRKQPGR